MKRLDRLGRGEPCWLAARSERALTPGTLPAPQCSGNVPGRQPRSWSTRRNPCHPDAETRWLG